METSHPKQQSFRPGGGGSYFPYILLNEIQTMFSQLAKRSAKVLPFSSPEPLGLICNHVTKKRRALGTRMRSCQRICVLIMCITWKSIDQRSWAFSSPEPVVSWSRGRETSGSGDENGSWEETKTGWSKAGLFAHYYILVIRKFIDFMSLFRHSVWFSFSVKQFPFAEFGICNI